MVSTISESYCCSILFMHSYHHLIIQPSVCQSASQKKITCQISLSNLKRTLGIVSSECSISYFKCTFDPFYNDRLQLTVAEERIVSFLFGHSTRQLYSKTFSIQNELSRSNPTIIEQWGTNFEY